MKKRHFLSVAFLSLLTLSCTKHEALTPQQCTLDDLAGTWIWVAENGNPVPNTKIEVGTINVDGTEEYWSIKDGKWTKTVYPISVSNGILYLGDVGACSIVNVDQRSLTIESRRDKTRYTASKVTQTANKQLYGSWTCDSYALNQSLTCANFQIVINEDNTYVFSYDGVEPVTGTFAICNEFMLFESDVAGSLRFSFDIDEAGQTCKHIIISQDGTLVENTLHRKPIKEFTMDNVIGIWLTTTKDGQPIPLQNATICEGIDNSGHTVISGIQNNTWVSNDVQLTVKNNVITRVINGVTDSYSILYFDKETIIWKSLQNGSVVTRKNIKKAVDYAELLQGYWRNDDFTFSQDGNATDKFKAEFIATQESATARFTSSDGVVDSRTKQYKVYGDYMALYDESSCDVIHLSFGFDAARNERYMKHTFKFFENDNAEFVFYKPDLDTKLAGGWIWAKEDGEDVSTLDLEVSFFNPITGLHEYQTFGTEAEHIFEPYYVEGRTIYYPSDLEYLYETILSIDNSNMVVKGADGITYTANRILLDNPLSEKIIGTWDCQNFMDDGLNASVTHTFFTNGLVAVTVGETETIYGTYKLYNSLLVIELTNSTEITTVLWTIKDFNEEDGTMTFSRLLDDGTWVDNGLIMQ